MARSYSKINEKENALDALEQINELDPSYLKDSLFASDFANIRDTERFKNLILTQGYGIYVGDQ